MGRLNYNHLRYFWAVARNGNLTHTAESLNVSQSALSIQIRKLEDRLGQPLFERRGKRLVLTEAGRIAFDHAEAIFSAGEELLATLERREDAVAKILRVGALSTLSRNFQIAFLRPLLAEPEARIKVRSGAAPELLAALAAQTLDVVLTNEQPPRDPATPWLVQAIARQPVSLVGYPERVGAETDLKALLARESVVAPSAESGIRMGFDAFADALGVRPRIVAEVDDMALLRVLARENVALAVVPPIVVKDELETGRLAEVASIPGLNESFYAVTIARRFPNPLLKMLLPDPTGEGGRGGAFGGLEADA